MSLYRYLKSPTQITYPVTAISLLSIHKNKILLAASYVLITTGIFLVSNALLPIITYELFTSKEIARLETPRVLTQTFEPASVLAQAPPDLTKANNWFVSQNVPEPPIISPLHKIEYYNLSIPKLGIKGATVKIAGEDLNQSLIQYKGTADPGQPGNPVIFGHSVLPQFFNPKKYISIFSTLPTLKPKDEIYADIDGIEYKYEVTELKEIKPTDISVLEQRYDRRELTLVTCVPPGTYLRRLVVKSRLVNNKRK